VVFSPEEAKKLGLEIDHDDRLAYGSEQSFALLLHGQQRPETQAAKAMSAPRKVGLGGYSRKASKKHLG
jgi:hypothetical protein